MMSRRRFLRTVGVSLLAAPIAAEGQAGKVYRVGNKSVRGNSLIIDIEQSEKL